MKEGKKIMKNKLVLNNQTSIEIESGSSLSDMTVISATKEEMVSTWNLLTEDNLKLIQIQNEDGTVIGVYENILLDNETSTVQSNETILTSFHLRKKTAVELLRERVEQLESGQEVLDGAVSDLGAAVSELADEGGIA